MRVLEQFRLLNKYYMIAADASGVLVYNEKHCEHCLEKKYKNHIIYYHPVLELKLVTANGMALSIDTKFIENPAGWDEGEKAKQDCELKAFYRVLPRLKENFPKLPFCFLLDGLYPCEPVFQRFSDYNWKFMIILKDKKLKSVNEEFESISAINPSQDRKEIKLQNNTVQNFRWVNAIEYKKNETGSAKSFLLNVLEQKEIGTFGKFSKFKWVTNIELTEDNVDELSNGGGRLRWKIENEGFNTQKNGGYELEHCFSEDPTSAKVFYLLLQIACVIAQLIELGSYFKRIFPKGFGSSKNISQRLLEAFRYLKITKNLVKKWLFEKHRISFNTS